MLGTEKNLREDEIALHGLAGVFVEQLLQILRDGDVDGDLDLVGNLATDIGQFFIIGVVVVPFEISKVFQVGAVAEIEDNPPISGLLAGTLLIVADFHDVGNGDEILLAAGALLDGELRGLTDDVVLAKVVHHGTESTEIDAARGCGQASSFHRGILLFDEGFIDEGRHDLGFLARDIEDSFLGAALDVTGDLAAEEAVEALQGVEVLLTGLLGVLALAKLHPVFKESDGLGRGLLGTCEDDLQVLEGEIVLGIEGIDGIVDFLEALANLGLGFADLRGAGLDDEGFGVVLGREGDAGGQIQLVMTATHAYIHGISAVSLYSSDIVQGVDGDVFRNTDEERFVH